jgi:hypothetical protein
VFTAENLFPISTVCNILTKKVTKLEKKAAAFFAASQSEISGPFPGFRTFCSLRCVLCCNGRSAGRRRQPPP